MDGGERVDRRRRTLLAADLGVKAGVLALLALALAFPDWERFAGKAMAGRAVAYPLALLVVPLGHLAARRRALARRGVPSRYPVGADLLFGLPWLVDLAGNAVDAFDRVGWFDDAAHLLNWALLTGALVAVLPRDLPRWVAVLLATGTGCLAALGWELAEYATFIRGGAEEATAYRDTLGDMSLGTLGALLSAAVGTGLRRAGWRGTGLRGERSPVPAGTGSLRRRP